MKATIAIDLGGTRIKTGIVSNGEVLNSIFVDAFSDKGLLPRLPLLDESIDHLMKQINISIDDIAGFGISIPGIVDSRQMKLLSVNKKFNDAVDFDFPAWAFSKWHKPLVIENDARCALVGEWQFGAGKGSDNLVMITLGTGVGGAAIIEGKLLRGKHFQAGCLGGHFTVNYKGDTCNCGNIGCVESEASTWRLPEMARSHMLFSSSQLSAYDVIDYRLAFGLAGAGDELSKILVNQSLDAWSAGIVNSIHAYDPDMVILGGGIMKSGETILPYIREKVQQHAWTPWGKVEIVPALFPDSAALYGLDYLVKNIQNI
jgi:glucokinase